MNKESDSNSAQGFGELVAELYGFDICQEPWDLYYDETQNFRSVSYREGAIKDARAIEQSFILGGIVITDPRAKKALTEGISVLPSPSGEVKSKPVLGGSANFWTTLRRREVTSFLHLIDRPGVAVHYHAQDNLYYSIVDIVDSLILLPGHEHLYTLNRELKNELYLCVSQNPIEFLNGLAHFDYPNVAANAIAPFCNYIINVLALRSAANAQKENAAEGFLIEMLRQMLKTASQTGRLSFLEGNKKGFLIEGFSAHYQSPCMLLPKAAHHFDTETHISMDAIKSTGNFIFVDSKSEPLIQLSDVWVGLLSRLFTFLDRWVKEPNLQNPGQNMKQQQDNLRIIKRLIDGSDSLHRSLLSNCAANDIILAREKALAYLCDN